MHLEDRERSERWKGRLGPCMSQRPCVLPQGFYEGALKAVDQGRLLVLVVKGHGLGAGMSCGLVFSDWRRSGASDGRRANLRKNVDMVCGAPRLTCPSLNWEKCDPPGLQLVGGDRKEELGLWSLRCQRTIQVER